MSAVITNIGAGEERRSKTDRIRAESIGRDGIFVALALAHGLLLLLLPSIPLIGFGLWWNANTIAHNFIHRPFFRSRSANALFSCALTLLLGFPQSLWRARHLAHHAGKMPALRLHALLIVETGLALLLWSALLLASTAFALEVCLPGFLLGLGLCQLQGRYEHLRGTTSHYGRLYNWLFFNDGYHCEHHARPGARWSELPRLKAGGESGSRWPAVLRWLEGINLCALERLVLGSPRLQRFVLDRHERAFRRLLDGAPHLLDSVPQCKRIGIVGGGLYPRTAIVLSRLRPEARLALIDMSAENLSIARRHLSGAACEVEAINERFDASAGGSFDLLVIPLAYLGDREALYRRPPAPLVLIHDWIWRRRARGVVVSWLLLKRLNLVQR